MFLSIQIKLKPISKLSNNCPIILLRSMLLYCTSRRSCHFWWPLVAIGNNLRRQTFSVFLLGLQFLLTVVH
jgi:hypothetical protein